MLGDNTLCYVDVVDGCNFHQDRNKNGFVDADELTNLHSTTKERLTMQEARTILQVSFLRSFAKGCSLMACDSQTTWTYLVRHTRVNSADKADAALYIELNV